MGTYGWMDREAVGRGWVNRHYGGQCCGRVSRNANLHQPGGLGESVWVDSAVGRDVHQSDILNHE